METGGGAHELAAARHPIGLHKCTWQVCDGDRVRLRLLARTRDPLRIGVLVEMTVGIDETHQGKVLQTQDAARSAIRSLSRCIHECGRPALEHLGARRVLLAIWSSAKAAVQENRCNKVDVSCVLCRDCKSHKQSEVSCSLSGHLR